MNTNSPIIIDLSDQITGAVLYTGKFTDNKPGLATLTEIAAGSYKLSIFHDVNNNAQRDASEPFADYASAITITANSKASATITLPEGTGSGDNVLNVDYHYTGSHGIDAGHPLVLSAKNLTAESNASHTCSAGDGTWQFTGLTDGVYGISIYYDDNNNRVQDTNEPQRVNATYTLLKGGSTGNATITLTDADNDPTIAAVSPPTDFVCVQRTTSSLQISWTAPAGGADAYIVYVEYPSAADYFIMNVGPDTNYTLTGLQSGAVINFVVKSVKAFSVSSYLSNFPCQTKALPPNNFHIEKDSDENHFYWDEVLYASAYFLKESTDAAQTQGVVTHTISSATSCVLSFTTGTVRYYSVSTWLGSPETTSDPTPTLPDINYCPSPTINTAAASSSSEILLSWSLVYSAQTYNIYRDESSTGSFATLAGTTTHPTCDFMDEYLTPLKTYYYKVSAQGFDALTESPKSSVVSATTLSDVPSPENVSATQDQLDSVLITWDAVAADHYRVFRCDTMDGDYNQIGGVITSPTEYTDGTGTLDAWYYYKVRAYNINDDPSAFSSPSAGRAMRITAPATISGTFGTYSDRIVLTWGAVTGAEKYRLYRADTEYGAYAYLAETATSAPTYDDTSAFAFAGFDAWYKVKAVSAGGNESLLSTQKGKGYVSHWNPTELIPSTVDATYNSGSGHVDITWSAVSGYSHYQVQRLYNMVQDGIIAADTTSLSATDSSPVPGRTYYYTVLVLDSVGRTCAYAKSDTETIP